jgi:hypothetical protein
MSGNSQPAPAPVSSTFTASNSPPLILAFLAIGLFSAAIVFVFWRRIQGSRSGWRLATTRDNIDRSLYFNVPFANIDSLPKLWDLSNGGNFARGVQGEEEGAVSSDVIWANLMVHIVFFSLLRISL